MIAISTFLAHLARPDVTEVCLTAGQKPTARRGNALVDLDAEPLSADDLLRILFSAGGSRYVESLGARPAQWRTRVEGVGAVNVSAAMNGDVIEARFALRDAPSGLPPAPPAPPLRSRTPSIPPTKTKSPRASSARPPPLPEGAPSSRRKASVRNLRPERVTLPELTRPSSAPLAPHPFDLVDGLPPPRLGMISASAIELDIEIPSVPNPPGRAQPKPPPPLPKQPPPLLEGGFARRGADLRPQTGADDGALLSSGVQVDESPSAPMSPRTLPEARFNPVTLPPAAPDQAKPSRGTGRSTQPFGRERNDARFRALLRSARTLGASDLHLVAGRPPLLRLAGQLVTAGDELEAQVVEDMVLSRVPRRLEEVLARDGSCDFALDEGDLGRYRANVSRQRTGIKASLRLVSLHVPTLATLGLPEAIGAATHHHQGLIVLTGPTGHGKTTTLAAVVDILNTDTTRHVITVEDPIEYIHPRKRAMMSQREVGTHTKSFHSALKAALREDPDVIVIGELRDTETVRIALEASETGHLVLGTMSTPSASKAIDRLIDLFPPGDQQQVRMTLAGGLRLIVSQRLVPSAEGKTMVAAAELLPGIVPLWNLIRDNRTYQIPSLQQRGRELGVIRLDDSLRDLVRAGRISAADAVAAAEAPEELEQVLHGRPAAAAVRMPEPKPSAPASPDGGGAKGIFDRVFKKGG